MSKLNIYVILRMCVGLIFVVSGFEKLIYPYQNFLYVIENYQILTSGLRELTARVLPWVELFLGAFCILGIWLKWSLRGLILMVLLFMVVVTQALLRNLPIDECGCFGQLITLPLHGVLMFDTIVLGLLILMIIRIDKTGHLGLDQYYS